MNGLTKNGCILTKESTRDYLSFMRGRHRVGASPLVFTAYEKAGNVSLLPGEQPLFIFVLQGAICCDFKDISRNIHAGEMFALDPEKLNECRCTPQTMLMEYIPPQRMLGYLRTANKSFHSPCSDHVQFDKHLYDWCEMLLTKHDTPDSQEKIVYHKLCDKLSTTLLQYPQGALGTLYIPLYACKTKQGGCAACLAQTSSCSAR